MANVALGYVGDALFPVLVTDDHVGLILLAPNVRNFALVANALDPSTYYGVGIIRLLVTDPFYYLLGLWYGEAPIAWMERHTRVGGTLLRRFERGFGRFAYPVLFAVPSSLTVLLAGAASVRLSMVLLVRGTGMAARLYLIRKSGEAFEGPLDRVTELIGSYQAPLLVATTVLVVLSVVVDLRKRTSQREVPAASARVGDTADPRPTAFVSAVLPVRNEQHTIGPVLDTVCSCRAIDEVVVVLNGCTDTTRSIIENRDDVVTMESPKRGGKGRAVEAGLRRATNDLVVLVDGDLIGLEVVHLELLIGDLQEPTVAMSLGLFDRRRRWRNWIYLHILPRYTGQRCVHRQLALGMPKQVFANYRVEAGLNAFMAQHGTIEARVLDGLKQRTKRDKSRFRPFGGLHEIATIVVPTLWHLWFRLRAKCRPASVPNSRSAASYRSSVVGREPSCKEHQDKETYQHCDDANCQRGANNYSGYEG
jgi:hypothetical protein